MTGASRGAGVRISVVIPTCGRPQTLRRALEAHLRCETPTGGYELIVVDDGAGGVDAGAAATAAALAAEAEAAAAEVELTVLTSGGRGAAAARNAGAQAARGELLVFCDDDIIVEPDHLTRHLRVHATEPQPILLGGVRWYSPESLARLEATAFGRYRIGLERGFATGRGEPTGAAPAGVAPATTLPSFDLSLRRDVFASLGGFDESFPYAGAEDQDLSLRARTAGVRLLRDDRIRTLHDDTTVTLAGFGRREQRGAHTVLALVRKYPDHLGDFARNDPIARGDGAALIARKLAAQGLSRPRPLGALVSAAERAERAGLPDWALAPVFRSILGLHIFRGYRDALRAQGPERR